MTKKTTVYGSYRKQELVDKCVSKDELLENFKNIVKLRNTTITNLKAQIESLQKVNNHLTTRFNEEYEVNKIHTERIKELGIAIARNKNQMDTIKTLRMENGAMGSRAAGFETQIDELQNTINKLRGHLEHSQEELREREHRIRTIEADYSQESLGNQHLLDRLKQKLYNEQIKSTAYMTVIREFLQLPAPIHMEE